VQQLKTTLGAVDDSTPEQLTTLERPGAMSTPLATPEEMSSNRQATIDEDH